MRATEERELESLIHTSTGAVKYESTGWAAGQKVEKKRENKNITLAAQRRTD